MTKFIVNIPDTEVSAFVAYLNKKHFQVIGSETSSLDIPETHKAIVRERRKNSEPEKLLDWDKEKDSFKF